MLRVVYPTDETGRSPRDGRYPTDTDERGYRPGAGQPAYVGNVGYHPESRGEQDYPGNRGYPRDEPERSFPGNGSYLENAKRRGSSGNGKYSGNGGERGYLGNGSYPRRIGEPAYPETDSRQKDEDERGYYLRDQRERDYASDSTERTHALPPLSPPVSSASGEHKTWHAFLVESRISLRNERPLIVFCFAVAAIALLYNLFGAPDVLYDEAAYVWMAKQVALHGQLSLTNQPMFIHPPLMWLLEAGWLRLTGYASAPEPSAIYAARLLSASVGAIDVLLIAAMAYRLAGSAGSRQRRIVTGAVTILVALDPVLVRYDRQAVIEPLALLMSMLVMHAAWSLRARGTFAHVSTVGLLGGLALLTNEIAVFLVVVPVIFAVLERNGPLIRRAFGAFGISLVLFMVFFLWAVELGLTGDFIWVQTNGFQRLVGLIQNTGFNMPGVSLVDSLVESVKQYSSSYILLAAGLAAFIWCFTRKNNQTARFLAAWLMASYALAAYIAAIGTLNVNFFCYPLPGCIVGSVFLADAVVARWVNRRARRLSGNPGGKDLARARRLPITAGALAGSGLVAISAASWVANYAQPGDGVAQADQYIAANLPACAIVNASGDSQKYSYLLGGRNFGYFSVGPNALANGIHYFLLAPTDAIERSADMNPETESWIEDHGHRLAIFPSATYRTVQLWYVPSSPYDSTADLTDISDGVYVNTFSSDCGGYTVTNGKAGDFYSAYAALGGKGAVGKPVSRVTGSASSGYEQAFDGVVLDQQPGSGAGVQALPSVATLAKDFPSAYRQARLPPVQSKVISSAARTLLTNRAIARFYLGGDDASTARYTAAIQRYGQPLGPPSALQGGGFAQAFADVVLEVSANGESVHAATIAPTLLKAGVLHLPARATATQSPPPLPLGQYSSYSSFAGTLPVYEQADVKPFIETLAAALIGYGVVVMLVAAWRDGAALLLRRRHGETGRKNGR